MTNTQSRIGGADMRKNYTPAPWVADDTSVGAPEASLPDNRLYIVPVIRGRDHNEAQANARLVAAAPDLVEALQIMLEAEVALAGSGDDGFYDVDNLPQVITARAALKKAGVE